MKIFNSVVVADSDKHAYKGHISYDYWYDFVPFNVKDVDGLSDVVSYRSVFAIYHGLMWDTQNLHENIRFNISFQCDYDSGIGFSVTVMGFTLSMQMFSEGIFKFGEENE